MPGRREDRLQALAKEIESLGGKVVTVAGDVTNAAARGRCIKAAHEHFGGLDILVNNAGVGAIGPFETADPQRVRRLMEVDFFALVEMTRSALPCSSKAGSRSSSISVLSLAAAVCRTTANTRPVNLPCTDSTSRSGPSTPRPASTCSSSAPARPIRSLRPGPGEQRRAGMAGARGRLPRQAVARATVRGIRHGSHEITPYLWGKVLVLLNRISPWFVDKLMARYA